MLHVLTCVCSNMPLKQPWSGKRFAAYFADTRQCVSSDVHLQSSETDVLLLAIFTAKRFPRLSVAVQLFVLHQPGVSGVGLATQTALKLFGVQHVRVCQFREHAIIVVASWALRAAVIFGRRV